ncbi:hypothetical protein Btru_074440 [Bulinus truncatus]|nr:hypothetical protein Btru_074440 [Bulinus truncatus]
MEEIKDPDSGDAPENYWNIRLKGLSKLCLQTATADIDPTTKHVKNITNQCRSLKEYSGTVRPVKSPDDIEKLIALLELIRDNGSPLGLVLDPTKVSVFNGNVSNDEKKVIGSGITSKITVVRDRKLGTDSAQKTIMLAQFRGDQIRAWVHLGNQSMAPQLYSFKLEGPKVVMNMELIEGKTLQEILDSQLLNIPDNAVSLSFCVLEGLLSAYETLKAENFVHGDLHAGNVMIEPQIKIKLFDFDMARNFLQDSPVDRIKNDLLEIMRIFCVMYSGYDLENRYKAERILKAKSLHELCPMLRADLTEAQRRELFKVLTMLIDCVFDPRQENYGDTTKVAKYIRENFSNDKIKKQLAVILFPERFQQKDESDYGMEYEMDTLTVWDDPDLDEFVKNVTMEDLRNLGVIVL